jgi:hypothetical protein
MGNDGAIVQVRADGGNIGYIGRKDSVLFMSNSTTGGIRFGTSSGSTQLAPCDQNGALEGSLHDLGSSSYQWRDLYLSGGIQFDSRSNKLDDYEKGTFDSHIYDDHDDSLKISFTAQGDYVKIGNVLTFNAQCFANGVASTTFTGKPYMRLPFTIAQANATIAYIGYYNGIGTAKQGYVLGAGSNEIRFATQLDNPYNNQLADGDTWGGNVRLYISGTVAVAI